MVEQYTDSPAPSWWTAPGDIDTFAYIGLVVFFPIVLLVIHLYARFDRFAEHHSADTPMRTTVPTMLMVALAFEVFPPLSHFSILLPLALIAAALSRDYVIWSHSSEASSKGQALPADTFEDQSAKAQPEAGGQQRAVSSDDPTAARRPGRSVSGEDGDA